MVVHHVEDDLDAGGMQAAHGRTDLVRAAGGEVARLAARYQGQPEVRAAALAAWNTANPRPPVSVAAVADHIEYVAKIAGHDHVGIGGDLDGIPRTPVGLEGVEAYPRLFAELARRGWSDADLAALAQGNVLRVMERAEAVAAASAGQPPVDAIGRN